MSRHELAHRVLSGMTALAVLMAVALQVTPGGAVDRSTARRPAMAIAMRLVGASGDTPTSSATPSSTPASPTAPVTSTPASSATDTPDPTATPMASPTPDCTGAGAGVVLTASLNVNGARIEATFANNGTACTVFVGIASYQKFSGDQDTQALFDAATASLAPGVSVTLSVALPSCAYQADAFSGPALTSFAGGQRYGGRLLQATTGGEDFCGSPPTPSPTGAFGLSLPTPTLTPSATPQPTVSPTSTAMPSPTRTASPQPTPRAHISADPGAVVAGSTVLVSGWGYAGSESVALSLDGAPLAVATTTTDGRVQAAALSIAPQMEPGRHAITGLGSSSHRLARTTVYVRAPHPGLRLSSQDASPGDRLCAMGTRFIAEEAVAVAVDGISTAGTAADATGSFTSCFDVPGNVVPGANSVSATGSSSRTPAVASFIAKPAAGSVGYLVGASTAGGEDTQLALVNPSLGAAHVTLRFYLPAAAPLNRSLLVPAQARVTLWLSRYVSRVRGFALRVQAERTVAAQMIVDRPRRNPYTTLASGLLSRHWYLAEGYTGLSFHETLYLLNPGAATAHVRLRLLPANGRRARAVTVTVAGQRTATIHVDRLYPHAALAAVISADQSIAVERLLTFGVDAYGATGSAGAPAAATAWMFAEGAADAHHQTFLTILNPGPADAHVTAIFADSHGRVLAAHPLRVDARHRSTLRLNDVIHAPQIATTVLSDQPIVVERPFYLGNPNSGHVGASLVFGRNGTGRRWTFPAGDTTRGAREDILVYNPNTVALSVRATFYPESGPTVTGTFTVPPTARYTLAVSALAGLTKTRHAVQLTALGGLGFVAEQTVYDDDGTTLYSTAGLAE